MAAEIVELDRKNDNLSPEEVLERARRDGYDDVIVIGLKHRGDDSGLSVWISEMDPARAYFLTGKAANAILKWTD